LDGSLTSRCKVALGSCAVSRCFRGQNGVRNHVSSKPTGSAISAIWAGKSASHRPAPVLGLLSTTYAADGRSTEAGLGPMSKAGSESHGVLSRNRAAFSNGSSILRLGYRSKSGSSVSCFWARDVLQRLPLALSRHVRCRASAFRRAAPTRARVSIERANSLGAQGRTRQYLARLLASLGGGHRRL
jgi:hypothetical protein